MSVLGMIEFRSIAIGIRASDAMVKAAPVELLESRPIDPGKYQAIVTGDLASVDSSVQAGVTNAGDAQVVQSFVLANLHDQVIPALRGQLPTPPIDAVGVIETSSVAALIEAADAACKCSPVLLVKLKLARHIGGKGYVTFVGDVADVEASVEAGANAAGKALIEQVVIPNPYDEIFAHLTQDDDDCWSRK